MNIKNIYKNLVLIISINLIFCNCTENFENTIDPNDVNIDEHCSFFSNIIHEDVIVKNLISILEGENQKKQFVNKFLTNYGMPIWTYYSKVENDSFIQYAFPIMKREDSRINRIWVFQFHNELIYHKILDRNQNNEMFKNQDWLYDFFSDALYGFKSGIQLDDFNVMLKSTCNWRWQEAYVDGVYKGGMWICDPVDIEGLDDGMDSSSGGGGDDDLPSDPIPTGGGSSSPDPSETDPIQLDPSESPCEQVNYLANDSEFIQKMTILKSLTSENYEAAYMLRQSDDGLYDYEFITGLPDQLNMVIPMSSCDGFVHTHYDTPSSLSIFSPADIKAIYDGYIKLGINDLSTFTAGVITAHNTCYLLKVDNVSTFLNFGYNNLKWSDDFEDFEQDFMVTPDMSGTIAEALFLNAIEGSGLVLMKGDFENFTKWVKKELNSSSVPVDINCNN